MPEPQGLEPIEMFEISGILHAAFPDAFIAVGDRKYMTVSKEELMRYLKYDLTDRNPFIDEYYDCDDFTFALLGSISNPKWGALPFGFIWTERKYEEKHSINVFIDKDRELWIIEPQNDNMFEIPEDWTPYLLII
jgi:hypothetical protein